jgi:RNA polymerase sigma-70 factor (ECF subfamily)
MFLCRDRAAAEDLVSRTFARAVSKIASFRPNTNFYNWLYTILINFRRMDIRKARNDLLVLTDQPPDTPVTETPFTALAAKADHAAIRAAVAELSEPLKEVVILRYFEDFPLDEIAATLALPLGTVTSRLNYAKTTLAQRLAAQLGKEKDNE